MHHGAVLETTLADFENKHRSVSKSQMESIKAEHDQMMDALVKVRIRTPSNSSSRSRSSSSSSVLHAAWHVHERPNTRGRARV